MAAAHADVQLLAWLGCQPRWLIERGAGSAHARHHVFFPPTHPLTFGLICRRTAGLPDFLCFGLNLRLPFRFLSVRERELTHLKDLKGRLAVPAARLCLLLCGVSVHPCCCGAAAAAACCRSLACLLASASARHTRRCPPSSQSACEQAVLQYQTDRQALHGRPRKLEGRNNHSGWERDVGCSMSRSCRAPAAPQCTSCSGEFNAQTP